MEVEFLIMRVMIFILIVFGIFGNIMVFVKIVLDKCLYIYIYFVVVVFILSDLVSVCLYGIYVFVYLLFEVKEDVKLFEKFFMFVIFGFMYVLVVYVVFLVGFWYYCVVKFIYYEILLKRILLKILCIFWVLSVCFVIVYYIFCFYMDLDVVVIVLLFWGYLLCFLICIIIYFYLKKIMVIRMVLFF